MLRAGPVVQVLHRRHHPVAPHAVPTVVALEVGPAVRHQTHQARLQGLAGPGPNTDVADHLSGPPGGPLGHLAPGLQPGLVQVLQESLQHDVDIGDAA